MDHLNFEDVPMQPEEVKQLQLERLQAVLNRAARNVSYYHDLFRSINLLPEDITSLDDITRIPLTDRKTIVERQPYGMLAVAPREVVRIHTVLGPDGHPIVVAFTANDIRHWAQITARSMVRMGVTKEDAVQVCLRYSQSICAFGMHYAAESIGAMVIPRSNILMDEQILLMKNYRTTVLVCTPSYIREMIHYIRNNEFDAKTLFLRLVILVDGPWTNKLRKEVAEHLFVDVYGSYGIDEIWNPGVASEEDKKEEFFINEDHLFSEIVDTESGEVLPEGKTGELVLTTLTKEAYPLIRYKTGQVASLKKDEDNEGYERLKICLTTHRTDNLIYSNDSKFYSQQVGEILKTLAQNEIKYSVVLTDGDDRDNIEVCAEVSDQVFGDQLTTVSGFKENVELELDLKLGITAHVRLMEHGALENVPVVQDKRTDKV